MIYMCFVSVAHGHLELAAIVDTHTHTHTQSHTYTLTHHSHPLTHNLSHRHAQRLTWRGIDDLHTCIIIYKCI